jgi:hypothetical protein
VEKLFYGEPWARFIAGGWNSENGNIGGQIALASDVPFSRIHHGRNLEFHALASGCGDGDFGALPMARSEVEAVGACFERWGANVSLHPDDASSLEFAAALRLADVVHVSAHANFDRILLADGPFTTEALSALDLNSCRCRLLVLSACEAGNLGQKHALLWTLVRFGINVIAATRPVHDYTCKIFFEQLYAALLPTRRAQGIDLAEAIRTAVETTSSVLQSSFDPKDIGRIQSSFDQTIGAFMIFGDPSLSLRLVRPTQN